MCSCSVRCRPPSVVIKKPPLACSGSASAILTSAPTGCALTFQSQIALDGHPHKWRPVCLARAPFADTAPQHHGRCLPWCRCPQLKAASERAQGKLKTERASWFNGRLAAPVRRRAQSLSEQSTLVLAPACVVRPAGVLLRCPAQRGATAPLPRVGPPTTTYFTGATLLL